MVFWDGVAGVQKQACAGTHAADVLTLAASERGDTVFAAGVDSKVVMLSRRQDKVNKYPRVRVCACTSYCIVTYAWSRDRDQISFFFFVRRTMGRVGRVGGVQLAARAHT